jgi:hypothetical protein
MECNYVKEYYHSNFHNMNMSSEVGCYFSNILYVQGVYFILFLSMASFMVFPG